MVPLGKQRELLIETSEREAVLSVADTAKCIMRSFIHVGTGVALNGGSAHAQRLPPRARLRFAVEGTAPGITSLRFEEQSPLHVTTTQLISVKPPRIVRFRFVFLSDPVHASVRDKIETRILMNHVSLIFGQQANLILQEAAAPLDVFIPRDLGNPIRTSNDALLHLIEFESRAAFQGVDFVVFGVWDVESKRGTTGTLGLGTLFPARNRLYAFIEVSRSGFAVQAHVLAHEIGHVLGLAHVAKRPGLMFPTIDVLSNRLFAGDIEVVNPPSDGLLP